MKELLWCPLIGLFWAGLGMLQRHASRREVPVEDFMDIATLGAAAALLGLALIRTAGGGEGATLLKVPEGLGWVLAGAAALGCGTLALQGAYRHGPAASVFAVSQAALVVPFIAAALWWREPVGGLGWAGALVLVAGLLCIAAAARGSVAAGGSSWLGGAFGACALLGLAQAFTAVPSHLGRQDPAHLRPVVYLVCQGVFHTLRRGGKHPATRAPGAWSLGLAYAAGAAASLGLLFPVLDLLAARGLGGVVYPLALGTAIVAVLLYRRWVARERVSAGEWAGFACVLTGIGLLGAHGLQAAAHPAPQSLSLSHETPRD